VIQKIIALLIDQGQPRWWQTNVSMTTYIEQQLRNKELLTLICELAQTEDLASQVTEDQEYIALVAATEYLALRSNYKLVLAKAKRLSHDINELSLKLQKQRVFDVKGKSYHENQVLKSIISDEIANLTVDVAILKQSSAELQMALIELAAINHDLQDGLNDNPLVVPLSDLDQVIGQVPHQTGLKEAIAKVDTSQGYLHHYTSVITMMKNRNLKQAHEHICSYIDLLVRRLDIEDHRAHKD